MTADAQPFTHLESLLLFQSVATYGNTAESFARISASLKSSELLNRDVPADDSDRLNPQALTELYLRLLKAEAKRARQNATPLTGQDEKKLDGPTASRRSDVPSPKITTIEDAEPHRHLEPLMINRLYDLYKDQVIQEITDEERKYDELLGQVKDLELELEQGEKATIADDVLITDKDDISSIHQAQVNNSDANGIDATPSAEAETSIQPALETVGTRSKSERLIKRDKSSAPSAPSTPAAHVEKDSASDHAKDTILKPLEPLGKTDKAKTQTDSTESHKLSSVAPTNAIKISGNEQDPSSNLSPASPRNESSQSENVEFKTYIKGAASNVSTRKSSPARESGAVAQPATKSTGPPSLPKQSSLLEHFHPQPAPPNQTPQSSATAYSSSGSRGGGKQLPPFQLSVQSSHQQSQLQTRSGPELRNAATPVPKIAGANAKTPATVNQQAPIGLSLAKEGPEVYSTPGSDTKWKLIAGAPTNPLPRPRSVSPLSDKTPSPEPTPKPSNSRRQKTEATPSVRETRRTRATRASSMTSSAAPSNQARTRSPSVASTEEADSYFPNTTSSVKDFKQEVASPAADAFRSTRQTRGTRNTAATPAASTPAASNAPGKRKRRGTFDTDAVATSVSTSGHPSPAPAASSKHDKGTAPTITATRNFHKTSAPMLNNISSHKHASLFTGPVSSRAAVGYYDITKRPTDLSSIRKAIAAGHKAVAAATASGTAAADSPAVSTPGGPGVAPDAASTVTLPLSRDLVPPDGIVNAAQLEQEVMRMFANAVMFNDGTDGVVADTREMFEDTEKMFAAWRAAESSREQGEEGSAAGEDAGSGAGGLGVAAASAKRRRL